MLSLEDLSLDERHNVLARLARPCRRGHIRDYYRLFRQGRYIGIQCMDCHNLTRHVYRPSRNPKSTYGSVVIEALRAAAAAGLSQRQAADKFCLPLGTVANYNSKFNIRFHHSKGGRPRCQPNASVSTATILGKQGALRKVIAASAIAHGSRHGAEHSAQYAAHAQT